MDGFCNDYRDHLGHLRLSFRDSSAAPIVGVYKPPVLIQTNDYDSFGYEITKFSNSNPNNFKYQKQERIDDFGLAVDFFKYRPSDYQIGRFWQIDPLAEKYVYNSPYALQENKFGKGIELEGKELSQFDLFTKTNLPKAANSDNTRNSLPNVMLARDKRPYNPNEPIKGDFPNGDLGPASQQNAVVSQGKTDYTNDVDKAAQLGVDMAGVVEGGTGLVKGGKILMGLVKSSDDVVKVAKNGSTNANRLGQQMHKAYKADEVLDGVRIKEFTLPSGKRIDFIDLERKIIYELKPDNPRAIKTGYKQLDGYKQEVESIYGKGFTTVLDKY